MASGRVQLSTSRQSISCALAGHRREFDGTQRNNGILDEPFAEMLGELMTGRMCVGDLTETIPQGTN